MAIKNREVKFSVRRAGMPGHAFEGIQVLGFTNTGTFAISAWTSPPGKTRGTFHTTIPISSREYRERHGNGGAGFRIHSNTELAILDDYGQEYVLTVPKDMLNQLVGECIQQGLCERRER